MGLNNHRKGAVDFTDLLDTYEFIEKPYRFPYENYMIIGDTAEIDKIISTCGIINIDIVDIESTLSKDAVNYVTIGSADGEGCIANALKVAIGKLPIEIGNTSKILFNIWMPKNMPSIMNEKKIMTDYISSLSAYIDIIWGCAYDESLNGQQTKITLIAASK